MNLQLSLESAVLAVVMVTSFLAPFMGSSINLAIPAIGTQYSGSATVLSWVVAGYLLASAAFLLPFGRLADIVGRKKIYVTGIVLFSLFALLSGLAWSIESMIFFRVCQGAASAMIFSTGMAILTSVYPPERRGQAMGLTAAATYIGLSLGPVLGGFLNHNFGWRSIFYFTALIGLIAAILAAWRLKGEWADAKGEKFDLIGSFLCVGSLVAVLYGFSEVSQSRWGIYILGFGVMVTAVFICFESRQQYPIFHVSLFRDNKTFAFSNLAAMINYSATFAVAFVLSLYLQVVMGYDSQVAGLILLSQPIIMVVFSPLAGALSDRIEPAVVASWGMALSTLGLFLFSFLAKETSLWLLIANLVLIGLGFALFASPNNNAIMGAVEKNFYGIAAASLAAVRLIGQSISIAIVTMLLAVHADGGNAGINSAEMIQAGTRTAFLVFAGICGVGIFASLARGRVNKQSQ
ncbi:MFS transporter [Anaerospora hongkongensis]|uniref:MFS transporter n=1 Tax=Anaerospora hongkongensis TaxID=244830 RepID=UPI00289EE513|nr:MFS transporter [Anaerospora hongkongensis]